MAAASVRYRNLLCREEAHHHPTQRLSRFVLGVTTPVDRGAKWGENRLHRVPVGSQSGDVDRAADRHEVVVSALKFRPLDRKRPASVNGLKMKSFALSTQPPDALAITNSYQLGQRLASFACPRHEPLDEVLPLGVAASSLLLESGVLCSGCTLSGHRLLRDRFKDFIVFIPAHGANFRSYWVRWEQRLASSLPCHGTRKAD